MIRAYRYPVRTGMLLAIIAAAGCASKPNIRSDYDKSVDFSQYRTYNFVAGAGLHRDDYQDFFTKYMIAAISVEMEKRGYTKSDNPDLLVNFNANMQEKTKVTQTAAPPPMGGYYGYRGGFYDPWYGYGYATQTNVSQYTEGTVNIDLVDAKRHQLVWESVGIGRVTEEHLQNLEQTVNNAVPQLFAKYPFRAGEGQPAPAE